MDLLLCLDDNIHEPSLVTILSALRQTTDDTVRVHLLTNGLSDQFVRDVQTICALFGTTAEIITKDLSGYEFRPINPHIPPMACMRLLAASLLPEVDKVVYLDTDILVRSSLRPLADMDLGDAVCAGSDKAWVHHRGYAAKLGLPPGSAYVNSGVLVMDLATIRREGLEDRFVKLAKRTDLILPSLDQDVLNLVLQGRVRTFPPEWNFTTYEYRQDPQSCLKAKILHYTALPKPWTGALGLRDRLWLCERLRLREMLRHGTATPPRLEKKVRRLETLLKIRRFLQVPRRGL